MRRLAPLLLVFAFGLALAGCGGMDQAATTTTAASEPPGPGKTLYAGGPWAVVVDGGKATAFHKVAGTWKPDTSGAVKIRILGPGAKAARLPQVAAEISAKKPLVESGLWVDGKELPVKGGGITPRRGTIYGAPGTPLAKGKHIAVAYGRTDQHATAVAWSFRVS
ncbi:MAG: hypothetical protein ACJ77E_11005 [Gaiellaceae bacterium]